MVSLNLNFRRCEIGEDRLYNHRNLFAQEITAISERALCPFLRQIDQTEYNVVSEESNQLTQICVLKPGNIFVGVVGAVVTVALLGPAGLFFTPFTGALTTTCSNALITGTRDEGLNKLNRLITQYSQDRLARLSQKTRTIADRISQLERNLARNQVEEEEIYQLRAAQAHFYQRWNEEQRRITVNVGQQTGNPKEIGFIEVTIKKLICTDNE